MRQGVSLILILSDINMPGMSGLELLPKAKSTLRPDVPVNIMITAYGDAETKRKALENSAEALLTKPIDFGTLRSEPASTSCIDDSGCSFGAYHIIAFGADRAFIVRDSLTLHVLPLFCQFHRQST